MLQKKNEKDLGQRRTNLKKRTNFYANIFTET